MAVTAGGLDGECVCGKEFLNIADDVTNLEIYTYLQAVRALRVSAEKTWIANLSFEGGLGGKEQAGSRQDSRGRDCRASVSVDYNG